MVADKEISSWDILREPNRILLEEDYSSGMEMLIYLLAGRWNSGSASPWPLPICGAERQNRGL